MAGLKPLEQWICDDCHELIEKPEHGWIEWRDGPNDTSVDFRIVHFENYSPRRDRGGDCYYKPRGPDSQLGDFLGPDGMARMLNCLERAEVGDLSNFLDTFRRLFVPNYEEAREFWVDAQEDGLVQGVYQDYLQNTLRTISERYGR